MTNAIEIHVNLWTLWYVIELHATIIEKFIKVGYTDFVQIALTAVLYSWIRASLRRAFVSVLQLRYAADCINAITLAVEE